MYVKKERLLLSGFLFLEFNKGMSKLKYSLTFSLFVCVCVRVCTCVCSARVNFFDLELELVKRQARPKKSSDFDKIRILYGIEVLKTRSAHYKDTYRTGFRYNNVPFIVCNLMLPKD